MLDPFRSELGDRVARIDTLGAALVAEVAARAVPDAVLLAVVLEALHRRLVARVTDEPHALGQGGGPQKIGI